MKRILPGLITLLVLAGCGVPTPSAIQGAQAPEAQVAASGTLTIINTQLEPLPPIKDAAYQEVGGAVADRILARDQQALRAFEGKKIKIRGKLDWKWTRWWQSRQIFLIRGEQRHMVQDTLTSHRFKEAIGKPVLAYVEVFRKNNVPGDPSQGTTLVYFLAGVGYE